MRAQFWAPPLGPGQQTRLSPPIGGRDSNCGIYEFNEIWSQMPR